MEENGRTTAVKLQTREFVVAFNSYSSELEWVKNVYVFTIYDDES
jgi:hypothetical protein